MEISCRSPQQINEDFMLSELESLKEALNKWYVGYGPGMPGQYYLRGNDRKRANDAVTTIEAAILNGVTLDSSCLARQTWVSRTNLQAHESGLFHVQLVQQARHENLTRSRTTAQLQ